MTHSAPYSPHVARLIAAGLVLYGRIDDDTLLKGYDGDEQATPLAVLAVDEFREALAACLLKERETAPSPFRLYRDQILGESLTGLRLSTLVLHLHNAYTWEMNLPQLLDGADETHRAIALEIIAGYNGPDDPELVALATHILNRDHPELRAETEGC